MLNSRKGREQTEGRELLSSTPQSVLRAVSETPPLPVHPDSFIDNEEVPRSIHDCSRSCVDFNGMKAGPWFTGVSVCRRERLSSCTERSNLG